MSQTVAQFIAHCRSQIGVKENPPNSNDTPYGVQFGWNGVAWCSIFAWCMYTDSGIALPVKSASVVEVYQWAEQHGYARPSTEAVAGDVICRTWTGKQIGQPGFDANQTHMQIMLGKQGNTLDLIGGNQSDPSGGIVSYDSETAGDATILGSIAWTRLFTSPVASPPVTHSPTPPAPPSNHPTYPLLYEGCPETSQTIPLIKSVQTKTGCTADGDFGPITKAHVETFQSNHHLSVDGVVGPQTYSALGM
jgi:peptidoglycan hydrolase-like protein with peptidoglycan-binding domain